MKLSIYISFFVLFFSNNAVSIEKKYRYSDCLTEISFDWDEKYSHKYRSDIYSLVRNGINDAIASQKFPLFSAYYSRKVDKYVLYFAGKCEKRKFYTRIIFDDYIYKDEKKSFPYLTFKYADIDDSSYGVEPTGWWIDK